MTRRDYEAIARALRETRAAMAGEPSDEVQRDVAVRLANHCAADNPRFDRARFLKACGVAS